MAQATEQGYIFVLNRETGEPLFPVRELPVRSSTVPGEKTSPTQPFPTLPEPFTLQQLTAADLTNRTPEAHAWAEKDFLRTGNRGQYVRFELNHTY